MWSSEGAQDVTELLIQAAQQLRVGEMIHTESFDLGGIMNAVEIGDSRLDAGVFLSSSSSVLAEYQDSPSAAFLRDAGLAELF